MGLRRVIVGFAFLVLPAPYPVDADPSRERLSQAIDAVVATPALAHAFWGIEVRSLASGDVLYARNSTKAFRPASTLKLVTTAAALDAFGPDARVRTTLETAARLDGRGRLLGDVYLVGRGDASLSGRFLEPGDTGAEGDGPCAGAQPPGVFEKMAVALAAAGVRRIEGRLVGHEGAFIGDPQGLDWMREDLDWGYGAPVSALSYADNALCVTLLAGEQPGDPAVLEVVPPTPFLAVESTVVTGSGRAEEDIQLVRVLPARPGPERARLSGVLPLGSAWDGEVAVGNPALFAATTLRDVLESRDVSVAGPLEASSDPLPPNLRVIAAHDGVPLARLIEEVNKESQNLHAELLLRRLGLAVVGEGGTEAGLQAVEAFLDRLQVPHEGWGLKDGSGLSHSNLVTPRGMAALLVAMDRHPHAQVFRSSLSVSGVDGHLEERLRGTLAEGRVAAKTGGMQSVSALAGYVTTGRDERLAFAVFINNHVGLSAASRAALDGIAKALSQGP